MKNISLIVISLSLLGFSQRNEAATILLSNVDDTIQGQRIQIGCVQTKVDGIVVRNQREYKSVWDRKKPNTLCSSYEFPAIDFKKYTLLGIGTSSVGCKYPDVEHLITKDGVDKNYQFVLRVTEMGACETVQNIAEWYLVPKIENTSNVEFKIIKRRQIEMNIDNGALDKPILPKLKDH